ncbi:unnamed protein product, partial [marine sediment metagenome]
RKANYATVGISKTTADLMLYEGGSQAVTRLTERDLSIEYDQITANTIKELVDAINSDTSGYWNAELGPDAWEHLNPAHMHMFVKGRSEEGTLMSDIQGAIGPYNKVEFVLDVDQAKAYSCGVKAEDGARIRLTQINESSVGSQGEHWLEVWSGGEMIHIHPFTNSETNTAGSNLGEPIAGVDSTGTNTPNTVNLAEGHQGLGGALGENLCVLSKWSNRATVYGALQTDNGTYVTGNIATGNLSIIYDVIKP